MWSVDARRLKRVVAAVCVVLLSMIAASTVSRSPAADPSELDTAALYTSAWVTVSRPNPTDTATTRSHAEAVEPRGALVTPESPYGMSVGPNGALYVVDAGRDEILRYTPGGSFRVIAGDGHRGLSGDGGLSIDAKINVNQQSGVAVANDGTVYFSDTGNGRVREVLPDGIIKTVIGGGPKRMGQHALPARDVNLKVGGEVSGLTLKRNGDVCVAAGPIYCLENGELQWVVGEATPHSKLPKKWKGVYSNPAIQYDFAQSGQLAFDARGDLFVSGGGGGFALYERTDSGVLRFCGVFRGDGGPAALATLPNGSVLMAYRFGLADLPPSGRRILTSNGRNLNHALNVGNGRKNTFIGGDGVAVARNGTIYVDTNVGNAFTSVTAIVEITPNGQTKIVWRS